MQNSYLNQSLCDSEEINVPPVLGTEQHHRHPRRVSLRGHVVIVSYHEDIIQPLTPLVTLVTICQTLALGLIRLGSNVDHDTFGDEVTSSRSSEKCFITISTWLPALEIV